MKSPIIYLLLLAGLASAQTLPPNVTDVSPRINSAPNVALSINGRVFCITAHPFGSRLYAGTYAGVWRSDDGGKTWYQLTWPFFKDSLNGALGGVIVHEIEVSPADPDIVVCLANDVFRKGNANKSGLYCSKDGGAHWTQAISTPNVFGQIEFDPVNNELIYVAMNDKVAYSRNHGVTWNTSIVDFGTNNIAISNQTGFWRRVYALSGTTLQYSDDGGVTWARNSIFGFGGGSAEAAYVSSKVMAINPANPNEVFISRSNLSKGPAFLNPLGFPNGTFCNASIVIDTNSNNLAESQEPHINYWGGNISGQTLLIDSHLKFIDVDNNMSYASGEPIVYDANNDNIASPGEQLFFGNASFNGAPLLISPFIKYIDEGHPFGMPCSDGSIWSIKINPVTGLPPIVTQLPGPPVFRDSNSGNVYVRTHDLGFGRFQLFFSDHNHVFVCNDYPTSSASWNNINANNAFNWDTDPHEKWRVHEDPHALTFSSDFEVSLAAVNKPFPFNQNASVQSARGKLWVANDGSVYRSDDGGLTWTVGNALANLSAINVAVTARQNMKPTIYSGTGDNEDFVTTDGGASWKDAFGGCGDCDMWFADPTDPTQVLGFKERATQLWIFKNSLGKPDAIESNLSVKAPCDKAQANTVSWYGLRGSRPLILRQPNETTTMNVIVIRSKDAKGEQLVRCNDLSMIHQEADWSDTTKIQNIGRRLPFNKCGDNLGVCQAAGGKNQTVYYAGDPLCSNKLYKWKPGMMDWQELRITPYIFFANPYNAKEILAETDQGIMISTNEGNSFLLNRTLDSLITENQQYSHSTRGFSLVRDMIYSPDSKTRVIIANSGVFISINSGASYQRVLSSTAVPMMPSGGYVDVVSDPCDHAVYLASSRGWTRIGHIPDPVNKVNITSITGKQIMHHTTSWQTTNGSFNLEHLAGVSPEGDLITFIWSPAHDWQAINVSQISGKRLSPNSNLTSWQTRNGSFNVEHLAGYSDGGDMITFWWSPAHDWQAVNVSQIAGKQCYPFSGITSWQTKNGNLNIEHLAGITKGGELITFRWSPAHDWQMVNVSQIAHVNLNSNSAITSWQTKNGPYNVEHLGGINVSGDIITFIWSPSHDWQAVNVSQIAGQKVDNRSGLTNWQSPNGPFNVEHLAAISTNGDVFTYWWSPQHDWQKVNVSQIAGEKADPTSALSWQTKLCSRKDHISAVNAQGDLIGYWWSPATDWRAGNLGKASVQKLAGAGTAWQTKNGVDNIEHIAGVDSNKNLIVLYTRDSGMELH